jgi:Asp/Glu/hydantoin racemase
MAAKPRILLVNGNSSEPVTDRLAAFAGEAAPQFDFRPYTPAGGPPYVSTPADVALAAAKVVETIDLAVRDGAPDGCIIACFGEPGLLEARRRFDFPVVGMAEASMLTAMQLGDRFAILTLGEHWPAMLGDLVRLYGVQDRCAGIARIPGTPFELMADPRGAAEAVAAAAKEAGAEIVIIGGAALVGVASAIGPLSGLCLIDCLQASIAQMAALIEYRRMAAVLTSSTSAARRP